VKSEIPLVPRGSLLHAKMAVTEVMGIYDAVQRADIGMHPLY
jgi:hypothetical protein